MVAHHMLARAWPGGIGVDLLTGQPREIPHGADIYICGFPCKPYSSLRRHSTKLLKEASAKPFFAVVRLLRERRPVLAVLENVRGIQAVFKQVFAQLRRIAGYFVFVVPMDSADLGEPVSRPRFYFVLVRQVQSAAEYERKQQWGSLCSTWRSRAQYLGALLSP